MRIVLGIALALFIFAVILTALLYVPLLPLFVGAWFVELFGDIHTPSALPLLYVFLLAGLVIWGGRARGQLPSPKGLGIVLAGGGLLALGASMFGGVWETLQAEQAYAARQAGIFSSSGCMNHPTACLIKDNPHYSSQVVPAIVTELIWYAGAAVALHGFHESYWRESSERSLTAYVETVRQLISTHR